MAAHILIVDDDKSNLKLNRFLLEEEGFEVSHAHNGSEALTLLGAHLVDLVVLDVMMPVMDGYETLRRLRALYDTPVLFLSAKSTTRDKIDGLGLGADDYLAKPYEPGELLARIRAILRRTSYFHQPDMESKLQVNSLTLNTVTNEFTDASGRSHLLTPIECRLLYKLMSHPSRTLTHEQLIDSIWDWTHEGYTNQLAVYVRRLRMKIEPDPSTPRYVLTDRGHGYRFEP